MQKTKERREKDAGGWNVPTSSNGCILRGLFRCGRFSCSFFYLLVVPFVLFRPFSPKGGAYLALIGDMELGIQSHGLMGKSNVMFEAFGNLQLLGMMAV